MTRTQDEGYILASALGVLLAISIVAAALVGSAGETLTRVKRAELSADRKVTLESALTVVVSQLVLDPRRRAIDLEKTTDLQVLGSTVRFRIAWESNKLDLNRSEGASVEARLVHDRVPTSLRQKTADGMRRATAQGDKLRLLSDLGLSAADETCIARSLTVFGGQSGFDPENLGGSSLIGRPASGSRIAIDVAIQGMEAQGLSTVILLTGGIERPWEVLDWRRSSALAEGVCDEA